MNRTWLHLIDMRSYAEKALRIVEGVTEEEFRNNEEKQLPLPEPLRLLVKQRSQCHKKFESLPQKFHGEQITGTRDKLIHHYFGVDIGILWRVALEDLKPLLTESTC